MGIFRVHSGGRPKSGVTYFRNHTLRTRTRWAIFTTLLAGGLFLAAGSIRIETLRAYISVFSALL